MPDHEHSDLESKIRSLENKISDLDYDMRHMKRELEAEISHKADAEHSHEG